MASFSAALHSAAKQNSLFYFRVAPGHTRRLRCSENAASLAPWASFPPKIFLVTKWETYSRFLYHVNEQSRAVVSSLFSLTHVKIMEFNILSGGKRTEAGGFSSRRNKSQKGKSNPRRSREFRVCDRNQKSHQGDTTRRAGNQRRGLENLK